MFYGTYTINKWEVKVEMPTPWSYVYFTLQLANGERGRFTHLVMESHSSVPRNDQANLCHHSVKSSDVFTVSLFWTEKSWGSWVGRGVGGGGSGVVPHLAVVGRGFVGDLLPSMTRDEQAAHCKRTPACS